MRHLQEADPLVQPLVVEDEHAEELRALARAGGTDPRPLLGVRRVFGDLAADPEFVTALGEALHQIETHGVRTATAHALDRLDGARAHALLPA
jgi:fructuronate reductase/mannitol 2-dehydrogenase